MNALRSFLPVLSILWVTTLSIACGGADRGGVPEGGEAREGTPLAVADLPVEEGFVEVTGGRVWYRKYGSSDATPLLLLHGGPGASSHYLEPLRALADERPVILYDQLGSGRSERPDDLSLWTVERFMEELAQVREALGLERVHLLGHSWGSMLAADYLLGGAEGVESLILAGPALSIPRWLEDAAALRAKLPEDVQETLRVHEEAGTIGSEEYQEATGAYYRQYLLRVDPWPPEMDSVLVTWGTQVYEHMWGPTKFYATGTLKEYDRTDRLSEISVPTLFTCGRYDEATPKATEWYQSLVPGSRLVVFEDASHLTMLEQPFVYAQVVRDFLRGVEQG